MAPSDAIADDPVIAEYDVYITPDFPERPYVLQYPNRNREQPYSQAGNAQPKEMRIKPKAGLLELDVPMTVHHNFDRLKGLQWGDALKRAKDNESSTFGLASGFGNAGMRPAGNRADRGGTNFHGHEEIEDELAHSGLDNYENMIEKGRVLHEQTLGGLILPSEAGKPLFMLGAFTGGQLHLTKVDGLAQLRPQFHHIDAAVSEEKARIRKDREAAEPARTTEPRAVQLSMKASEGDTMDLMTTSVLLHATETETWTKLPYFDEETDAAYCMYHERLFVQDTSSAPSLETNLTNEQYIDAISAPRIDTSGRIRKKPLTRRQLQPSQDSEDSEDH